MTPKEKAKQLTERFYFSLPNNGSFSGPNNVNSRWEEGKKCALIAVDEIINFMKQDDEESETCYWANHKTSNYWLQVKEEIDKL